MENKQSVFGYGILKTSAREYSVFADEKGNSWMCNANAIKNIDHNKPFEEQHIERCQVRPFDFGG
jgi:streptogramin lyase